jgi:L-serine dehydratase
MKFNNGADLLAICRDRDISISEAMILRECDLADQDRDEIVSRMAKSWTIMKDAVHEGIKGDRHSIGGLLGGESRKMLDAVTGQDQPLLGDLAGRAAAYAMAVLEVNASMGLIVAAPTAGSSGVIPGVFLALQEARGLSDEAMVKALFNAGAVGYLIMFNASVAGAEGGCQAEMGSAAAMAASAAVELLGGSPAQSLDAASAVISSMLGLVCDPVAGLVESPCQKRNAFAATTALTGAQLALAGIPSLIPFDEMVEAMYRVGRSIPYELRETALGGIAATPTACRMCERIFGEDR